jgi:Kelch motif
MFTFIENSKSKSSHEKLFANLVWAENYFHLDCKNKMVLAFESGGPFFYYFLFKNITPFMVEDSIDSPCQEKQLNIDSMIPRNHASLITPSGRVFLCGGCDENGASDQVFELNFEDQTLIQKKSMNHKRFSHAICAIGSDLFMVAGGMSADKRYMDSCEIYDMKEDKWHNVARINKPAEKFCMTLFGNHFVYKFGGSPECSVERYNIKMNRWEVLNLSYPRDMATACECVQINQNQILIFGGTCESQFFFMNVTDSENGYVESLSDPEPIKFRQPGDSIYMGNQKSVVTYNRRIYAYDSGKQRIISYSGGSGWKISESL